jgi:parvulin-like peptidyl-prolyl isomerase
MADNDTPREGEEATYVVFSDEDDTAAAPVDDTAVADIAQDAGYDEDAHVRAVGDIHIDGEDADIDDADEDAIILDKPLDDEPKVIKPLPWVPMLVALLGLAALAAALYFGLQYFQGEDFGNAALVNGQPITMARLNAEMSRIELGNPGVFESGGYDRDEVRSQVLDELINQELLMQKADAEGVTVSDEDIDAELDVVKQQYGDEYEATLEQYGYTETELRDQIRMQLTLQGLIDALVPKDTVTDAMVKQYYEDNKETMFSEGAGKRVSHILFDPDDKDTAEQVLAQLQADDADFAALATEYSQDPGSAEGGGDLGWASSDNYVPEFKEAVDAMEKGEISDLVQTEYGWHIITITDTRDEGTVPFDDVADQIRSMLMNQEQSELYQNLMATLQNDAEIEILDPAVLAYREGGALEDELGLDEGAPVDMETDEVAE